MMSMTLSREDLGPKRRAWDRVVYIGMAFFIGWGACFAFYHAASIPALTENSVAWYDATQDRFAGICTAMYGPKKAVPPSKYSSTEDEENQD